MVNLNLKDVNTKVFRELLRDKIAELFDTDIGVDCFEEFINDLDALEERLSILGNYEKNVVLPFIVLSRSFYFNRISLEEFYYDHVTDEFKKVIREFD